VTVWIVVCAVPDCDNGEITTIDSVHARQESADARVAVLEGLQAEARRLYDENPRPPYTPKRDDACRAETRAWLAAGGKDLYEIADSLGIHYNAWWSVTGHEVAP
jgi:hypothetical protein